MALSKFPITDMPYTIADLTPIAKAFKEQYAINEFDIAEDGIPIGETLDYAFISTLVRLPQFLMNPTMVPELGARIHSSETAYQALLAGLKDKSVGGLSDAVESIQKLYDNLFFFNLNERGAKPEAQGLEKKQLQVLPVLYLVSAVLDDMNQGLQTCDTEEMFAMFMDKKPEFDGYCAAIKDGIRTIPRS